MGCSCHINPPCLYCTDTYECEGCGNCFNENEDPKETIEGYKDLCPTCFDEKEGE